MPACVAWMVQVPAATNVAVAPPTVQTLAVVEAKLTARPELAVALSASGVPTVCAPGLAKVMLCAPVAMLMTAGLILTHPPRSPQPACRLWCLPA